MPLEHRNFVSSPKEPKFFSFFLYGNSIRQLTSPTTNTTWSFYVYTAQDVAYIHDWEKNISLHILPERPPCLASFLQRYCKTLLIKNNICLYQLSKRANTEWQTKPLAAAVIEAMFAMKYSGTETLGNFTFINTRKKRNFKATDAVGVFSPRTKRNFQVKLYLFLARNVDQTFQFFA